MTPSNYPLVVDPAKVGEYPAEAKSGGGYFYDEVLEYRVWCRPWLGAPDEFNGDVYYYAFDSFEAAKAFTDGTQGRSEEHTSELQSRGHLVCRLLLEKKNTLSISSD